jgi:ketosteroid isomerase-like protein
MATALERWMDGYTTAWDSNDADDIGALFTDDAVYRSYPWAEPARGRAAIVRLWLDGADEPGDHRFAWHELGRDGDRRFVQGRTEYTDGRTYENLWIIDLDADGRARSFTEWYMESASKALGPRG